ncbi:flagellar basal-body MS-ring/collar protein FliF [Agathobaculum massiliense]
MGNRAEVMVKEKLQNNLNKVKSFFEGENKKKRIVTAAIIIVAVIIVSVIAAVVLNNRPYETLFTGLTTDEASAIVGKLEEYGAADYKIEGDTIKVPAAQEPDLKAKLLLDGYPKSGFGYDTYFNNISMMASDSDRDTVRNYELQDRMAAVIRCFEGVKDAVVNISEGSDQRYVLDSENATPATAAVFVTMQDGGALPENYVDAIGNLVARSVKGLEFGSITVTDSVGNSYMPGAENSTTSSASDLKLRLENQVNNRVRGEVMQALTPIYGPDNVRVSVTSTVDVSRRVQENTVYSSPEGAPEGEGIIGQREYDQELTRGNENTAGGVVGTQSNADIETYMESQDAVNGDETWIKNAGTEDYKVNSSTEQSEQNSGVVTDVMIAVTINQNAAGNVAAAQLTSHIARAAGIAPEVQADKINVLIAPFYTDTPTNTDSLPIGGLQLPKWAIYAIAGAVGLLLMLVILLLIIQRRRKKAKAALEELEQQAALAAAERAEREKRENLLDIQNEKSMELKQDIRKFTEENPEIAAQMIRVWLKGDGVNG